MLILFIILKCDFKSTKIDPCLSKDEETTKVVKNNPVYDNNEKFEYYNNSVLNELQDKQDKQPNSMNRIHVNEIYGYTN